MQGDDPAKFDAAVLAAPVITPEHLLGADCIIIGAPGRQGGFAGEVRLFLDSMASFQRPLGEGNTSKLMVRSAMLAGSCNPVPIDFAAGPGMHRPVRTDANVCAGQGRRSVHEHRGSGPRLRRA